MSALLNDLSDLTKSIVLGLGLSPNTQVFCPKYSVDTALDVYRNNYRGNLHDTLGYAYPVIEQLVGKEFFRGLTKTYIVHHPSRSGNLHHYGAMMSDVIAAFEPAKRLVYLPDVAALEWSCHRAYFVDDSPTLDVRELSKVPSERYPDLILHMHPTCYLMRSRYPITSIWNAHQPGANCDFHITLDNGPSNALVSRKNNEVIVSELDEADATWLQEIQRAVSLGNATAITLEKYPDFNLNAVLMNVVARGILTDFTFENR